MPVHRRSMPWGLVFVLLLVLITGHRWSATTQVAEATARPLPPSQPAQGLIYDGLAVATAGQCLGLLLVLATELCTHGPDPAPPGFHVHRPVPAIAAAPGRTAVLDNEACTPNDTSGNRTEVIYARAADRPDRYAQFVASIQQWVADADAIYARSAAETGGTRHIRYVTTPECEVVVGNVQLSISGDDDMSKTITELQNLGYNRANRKYLIFMDAEIVCGLGTMYADDRADPQNAHNRTGGYSRLDAGCWSGFVVAHELTHNLGGVQKSAPHSNDQFHCIDEYDVMCYPQPADAPMEILCPAAQADELLDCGHDDYFHTNPPAGSYLASHWNTADNSFLWRPAPPATATPSPTNTATATRTATDTPTSLLDAPLATLTALVPLPPLATSTAPAPTMVINPTSVLPPTATKTATSIATMLATATTTRTPILPTITATLLPTLIPPTETPTEEPMPTMIIITDPEQLATDTPQPVDTAMPDPVNTPTLEPSDMPATRPLGTPTSAPEATPTLVPTIGGVKPAGLPFAVYLPVVVR